MQTKFNNERLSTRKITEVEYLDTIRELSVKDKEIMNLEKNISKILNNDIFYLDDDVLTKL